MHGVVAWHTSPSRSHDTTPRQQRPRPERLPPSIARMRAHARADRGYHPSHGVHGDGAWSRRARSQPRTTSARTTQRSWTRSVATSSRTPFLGPVFERAVAGITRSVPRVCLYTDSPHPSGVGQQMLTLGRGLAASWDVTLGCRRGRGGNPSARPGPLCRPRSLAPRRVAAVRPARELAPRLGGRRLPRARGDCVGGPRGSAGREAGGDLGGRPHRAPAGRRHGRRAASGVPGAPAPARPCRLRLDRGCDDAFARPASPRRACASCGTGSSRSPNPRSAWAWPTTPGSCSLSAG